MRCAAAGLLLPLFAAACGAGSMAAGSPRAPSCVNLWSLSWSHGLWSLSWSWSWSWGLYSELCVSCLGSLSWLLLWSCVDLLVVFLVVVLVVVSVVVVVVFVIIVVVGLVVCFIPRNLVILRLLRGNLLLVDVVLV